MELSAIIENPSFRRIAACLRPATMVARQRYGTIPLATLADHFSKLSFNAPLILSNPVQYFDALNKLAAAVKKVNERLTIPGTDLAWLTAQIASPEGVVTAAMLAAYTWASEGRFVTPAELARVTGTDERRWRERAERGDIPAAIKKGKQWLLSPGIVEVMYGVDLAAIATVPDPDAVEGETPDLTEDEAQSMLDRLQRGEIDLLN